MKFFNPLSLPQHPVKSSHNPFNNSTRTPPQNSKRGGPHLPASLQCLSLPSGRYSPRALRTASSMAAPRRSRAKIIPFGEISMIWGIPSTP